jgi:hypothetical protein
MYQQYRGLHSPSIIALTEVPYQKLKTGFDEEENVVLVRHLRSSYKYFCRYT